MSIQEILKLPAADRLEMLEQIWDSLDPKDIKIPQIQKDELDRRLELDLAGKMSWHSVEEAKAVLKRNR